jgi:pyrrolidone-carboxylate peptidase
MRFLLYGFGPYRQFQNNISAEIVRKFPKRPWIKKAVFPVRFDRSQFINTIRDGRPEIILGLGQCSRGRLLRIERTAVNRRRNSKKEKPRPITAAGAKKLSVNLKLDLGSQARSSRDAGNYVCNYSMYVILDYLQRHRLSTRLAFVHIPHNYHPNKALRVLQKAFKKLQTPRS